MHREPCGDLCRTFFRIELWGWKWQTKSKLANVTHIHLRHRLWVPQYYSSTSFKYLYSIYFPLCVIRRAFLVQLKRLIIYSSVFMKRNCTIIIVIIVISYKAHFSSTGHSICSIYQLSFVWCPCFFGNFLFSLWPLGHVWSIFDWTLRLGIGNSIVFLKTFGFERLFVWVQAFRKIAESSSCNNSSALSKSDFRLTGEVDFR